MNKREISKPAGDGAKVLTLAEVKAFCRLKRIPQPKLKNKQINFQVRNPKHFELIREFLAGKKLIKGGT